MTALIDVLKNLLVKMSATQAVHIKKDTEALPLQEFLEYARAFAAILTPVRDEDAVLTHSDRSLIKSMKIHRRTS